MSRGRAIVACALAAVAALALAGCGDGSPVKADVDWDDLPGVATPVDVVRRLEWRWSHRDTTRYGELFSADFVFAFADSDTTAARFPGGLTRELEVAAARAILVTGSATEPPPRSVFFAFTANLIALPDPRPGRSAIAHRIVAAPMYVRLEEPDIEVVGGTAFEVVRGDSAAWPAGLPHVGPDSARWFIRRWEDLTEVGKGTVILPGDQRTLGSLKALYLDVAPAAASAPPVSAPAWARSHARRRPGH